MTSWTSDELNKIGIRRVADRITPPRRHAVQEGDYLGRAPG
jgi:hypothetical protein